MRNRWLIGCVALSACGGVVRSTQGGDGGGATTGATASGSSTSSVGGRVSSGGRSSNGGSPASAGTTSVGGQASMPVQCGKTFCPANSFCCNPVCGVCGSADGACPDIACAPPQDTCALLSPAPVVLACAQPLGKPSDPNASAKLLLANVEVESELVGALEGGCLEPLLRLQTNGPALSGQAMSWTMSDGKGFWDVEVVVEGNKIPSLAGQRLDLTYVYQFGGFGPTRRELSLVSRMNPTRGVWTAEGADLAQLGALPLQLARGPAVCSSSEQCGSYERYDLGVIDPLSMKTLSVPHGQTGTLGAWVVTHGGYAEQTSAGMCPDWFVADVHVAILGLM